MPKVEVKNLKGEKVEELELKPEVFGVELNESLVQQVYVSQYANQRQVIAHAKTRGERAGSGKKPWKQKGTGRARVGSVRTPVWRKGGIVFGPTKLRNFKKKINRKMNWQAIKMVLSGKINDKELIIFDKVAFENNKTREAAKAIESLKIKGSILWGFNANEKESSRASRNLERTDIIATEKLNVLDMLNNKYLILSKDSVKQLEEKYLEKK